MTERPDLSALARPGATFAVRVTPRARRDGIEPGVPLRIRTTAPFRDGRANEAARRLPAAALGVAPTRLRLVRGASARDKLFQLDPSPDVSSGRSR